MTRRVFTGALSKEIAKAEGQADVRERVTLLHQAAKGMLDLIRDGLIRDGAVRLHQFGTFRLKAVAARKGINPRTGAPLVIAAHRRVLLHRPRHCSTGSNPSIPSRSRCRSPRPRPCQRR
ncbi:MAG: HU family DNA-binding protein [Pseudomonadota bacterium]|nr:MAG: HU family DNA-binding protein [Pseudomonadota bacterium]